jgi:hypothetical protein
VLGEDPVPDGCKKIDCVPWFGALNGLRPLGPPPLPSMPKRYSLWVVCGGEVEGEKPLRLGRACVRGEERGGEPIGPKSCEGREWWVRRGAVVGSGEVSVDVS